jgi:hypothetical protein
MFFRHPQWKRLPHVIRLFYEFYQVVEKSFSVHDGTLPASLYPDKSHYRSQRVSCPNPTNHYSKGRKDNWESSDSRLFLGQVAPNRSLEARLQAQYFLTWYILQRLFFSNFLKIFVLKEQYFNNYCAIFIAEIFRLGIVFKILFF